jgi:hypothetical protein
VIRQAISCDICGTEKKLTNHWYVAYDQSGELRVSGLDSRNRLRPGAKHLCGQTCLHKLVDDFITRAQEVRPQSGVHEAAEAQAPAAATDTTLTSITAHGLSTASAGELMPTAPVPMKQQQTGALPVVVAMPDRTQAVGPTLAPDEPPRFASRNWRAKAWEREREREQRAAEPLSERASHRRSG